MLAEFQFGLPPSRRSSLKDEHRCMEPPKLRDFLLY
jgi:hypothetical protein